MRIGVVPRSNDRNAIRKAKFVGKTRGDFRLWRSMFRLVLDNGTSNSGVVCCVEDDAPGRPESSQVDRKYPGDSETAILGSWNRNQITGN